MNSFCVNVNSFCDSFCMRVEGIYLVLIMYHLGMSGPDVPDTALPDGTRYISLPVTLKC
jgi:hypothetical protein